MGNRGAGLASVDSYRVDSPLNTNHSFDLLPLGLLRHIAIWASTGITEAATSGPKQMSTLVLAIAESGLSDGDIPAYVGSHGIVRRAGSRQDDRLDSVGLHGLGRARAHAPAQHHFAAAQKIENARGAVRPLRISAFVMADALIVRRVAGGAEFPASHRGSLGIENHKSLALAKMLR